MAGCGKCELGDGLSMITLCSFFFSFSFSFPSFPFERLSIVCGVEKIVHTYTWMNLASVDDPSRLEPLLLEEIPL